MSIKLPVQLPEDVKKLKMVRISNFEWSDYYRSEVFDFEGTAEEFVKAGYGYVYIQIDKFTRYEISKSYKFFDCITFRDMRKKLEKIGFEIRQTSDRDRAIRLYDLFEKKTNRVKRLKLSDIFHEFEAYFRKL